MSFHLRFSCHHVEGDEKSAVEDLSNNERVLKRFQFHFHSFTLLLIHRSYWGYDEKYLFSISISNIVYVEEIRPKRRTNVIQLIPKKIFEVFPSSPELSHSLTLTAHRKMTISDFGFRL